MLFVPVLVLTVVVLAISIIGIPLLVLVPVAIVAALVAMLVGFTAVAYHVGRLLQDRSSAADASVCRDVRWNCADRVAGAARAAGRADRRPRVHRLADRGVGFLLEYIAWTAGLGAAALVRFDSTVPPTAGRLLPAGSRSVAS